MPDEELIELAGRGELRANLDAQLTRMLADQRSQAFVRDFVGQWLQARDVETISIDAVAALGYQKEWEAIWTSSSRSAKNVSPAQDANWKTSAIAKLGEAEKCRRPATVEKLREEYQQIFADAEKQRDAAHQARRNLKNSRRSAKNLATMSAAPCAAKPR